MCAALRGTEMVVQAVKDTELPPPQSTEGIGFFTPQELIPTQMMSGFLQIAPFQISAKWLQGWHYSIVRTLVSLS